MRHIGIQLDDALHGAPAWEMLNQKPGFLDDMPHVSLFGSKIFCMVYRKHGPGDIYSLLPFVRLWGATPRATRGYDIFFAFLAIAFTYLLGKILYRNGWVAFFASLLLAVCPGFVVGSVLGVMSGLASVACGVAGLYFWALYAEHKKPWMGYVGSAWLGFGLSSKSWFLAFVFGFLVYGTVFHRRLRGLLPEDPGKRRRFVWGCVLSFLIFMLPVLVCSVKTRGVGLRFMMEHWAIRADQGSNLNYAKNLYWRFLQLGELLHKGANLEFLIADPGQYRVGWVWSYVLAALLVGILGMLWVRRGEEIPRRWLSPWIIGPVYLLLSPFSPSVLRLYHLFPVVPLFYLGICSGICLAKGGWLRRIFLAGFVTFGVHNAYVGYDLFRGLERELRYRGPQAPTLSPAAWDVCRWALGQPDRRWLLFIEDVEWVLEYCGKGEIAPLTVPGLLRVTLPGPFRETGELLSPGFQDRWDEWLKDKRNYFVFSPEERKIYFMVFKSEAVRRHLNISLVKTFHRPNGEPLFEVYQVR